jgi:acetyl-CoA carboxylase biotin carboxyl carrier protein
MRDSHGESTAKPAEDPTREAVTLVEGAVSVVSPLVGVFYRAPKPGEPPFVALGESVEADTTIGLIEAMKVYVAVQAGTSGVVVAIEVEDSQPVEFGQALLWISPS